LQASQGGDSWIGLQIRLRRFDSDLGLHHSKAPQINVCGVFLWAQKTRIVSASLGIVSASALYLVGLTTSPTRR
ncbi:hypothetical protein, partial [Pseudomonas putida]|uniref:hypothetical protein n=1 Tax=Pseudomonas putida TaxID=303 RepID=UPI001C3FF91F